MAEVALRDYLNEIDTLIERNLLDVAIKHCRHILTQHPKCVDVYRLLGKALLEQEEDQSAQDVFQRVLSVDPEDFVARVGLAIVFDRNNQLDKAIWHMERAFDIAPSNALIQGELRRLYARRDGASPERIPLTRGALARMYAHGDLNSEAIADLRQLLREQPDRLDLQVEMVEVLWRDERRVEAAEWIQLITRDLPYCLKANLILGLILRDSSANGESDEPFKRAQAVDPENLYAALLFGPHNPLPQQTVTVDRLEVQTISEMLEAETPVIETEEVPDWLRGVSDLEPSPLLTEPEAAHAPRLSTGLHMPEVSSEIPEWLQGLAPEGAAAAEAEVPDWMAALTGAAVAGAAVEALSEREGAAEEVTIKPSDEEVPDWISQLGAGTSPLIEPVTAPPAEQEEEPDWMAQLREQPPAPFAESISPAEDSQVPDWLAQLQASQLPLETAETEQAAGEDWLTALHATSGEIEEEGPTLDVGKTVAGAAILATLEPGEKEMPPTEEEAGAVSEVPEEMPSADDALAFLSKLAAGKEDQLRAQAEQEADTRMAEIMGRKPAEPASTEKPGPIKMTVPAATVAAVAAGLVAGKEKKPVQEQAVPAETKPPAPAEVPEEMPSADDALAFLSKLAAGKEDQLRAQAEQEAEERMAEIMGRKPVEAKPTQEEKPSTAAAVALGAAAATAGLAAAKKKEPPVPAEVPEEMPSADDALAFLSKLAAGKEDQLRAQAEREAEERMATIMGRTGPVTSAPTAPGPEAEVPDWLQAMKPAEEALPAETPESEIPGWLRAMRPEEGAAEAGLVALVEESAAAEPISGLPGEVSEEQEIPGTQDLLAELAQLEEAAAESQAVSQPQTTAPIPLEWWMQVASDTEEEELKELPEPYLSPRARAAEKAAVAAAVAATTPEGATRPRTSPLPQTGPLRQTGPLPQTGPLRQTGPVLQTGPIGTPEPAISAETEALLSRIYQDPEDYAARLDLARTYWATGNREGAYGEYLEVVNAGEFTKETMADLETIVEIHDQPDWHRMLGDVYMKVGKLSQALAQYRLALSEL